MRAFAIAALAALVAACAPSTIIANKQQAVVEAWGQKDAVAQAEKECAAHGRWPMLQRQHGGEYWFSCNETEEAIAARLRASQEEALKRAAEMRAVLAPPPTARPSGTQVAALAPTAPAPAHAPMAPATAAPQPKAGLWVQVGAFGTRAAADRHLRQLRAAHGAAVAAHEAAVTEEPLGRRIVHVTRIGPFAQSAAARQACDGLKAQGVACFVTETR